MATTAYSYFTNVTQSGASFINWSGIDTLTTSINGKASSGGNVGISPTDSLVINTHTPEYMPTIQPGSELSNMGVKFKAYNSDGGGEGVFSVRQNSIETYSVTLTDETNENLREFTGPPSFWGLSGSAATIMEQIRTGAITFHYYFSVPSNNSFSLRYEELQVQLTFVQPDTTRASILVTMP
jgi:hypothetical protein